MPNKLRRSPGLYTPITRLLIVGFFVLPATAAATDHIKMLECIAQLETGTVNMRRPCAKIGAKGERSAWQISPAVWRVYCASPFPRASSDAKLGLTVAVAHLHWLRLALERAGTPATPYNLALAWNAGLSAALSGKVPAGAHDYAARFVALYESLTRSEAP